MKNPTLFFWLAASLLLTACSGGIPPGRTPAPAPDLSIFEPGAKGRSAVESNQGDSSRRVGNRDDQPYIGGWNKPGVTSDQQLADTEACYNYAWAQVNNDIRIDDDIDAARGQLGSEFSRLSVVTRQADSYYYRKERIVRLEDCMQAKGYSPE